VNAQEVTPLRHILRPREDTNRPDLTVLLVYRDYGVVPKDSRADNFNKTPADLSNYQVVRVGDLAVNKMKAWQGSLAVSEFEGIVSPDYLVCSISPEVHGRYIHYLLRSSNLIAEYRRRAKGVRPAQWRIYWEDLAAIRVFLPSLPDQKRIADFLDSETTRIDTLIAKKRRMIALSLDRSIARVFAAVRGAFETGPRKPSGLEWLGDVPGDWPVANVTTQFEVLLGKMLNPERTSGPHLKPYLRNTNVQWDHVAIEDLLEMDFPPSERSRFKVLAGDLLVCEGGEPGRAAIWDGSLPEIYYQKALHRIRPRGYSLARWLFYCLKAATALNVFAVEGNTTTIAHLTGEQLRSHRFTFPDRSTQERIVAFLDKADAIDKKLMDTIERQVALLQEHRLALITAAVTGELDALTQIFVKH
jgi:type I restriction enzyme S subunit